MATVVNTSNLNNKLKAITTVLQRPMRETNDLGAHILCIECTKTSQPFGTGFEAKQLGETAVARDILKVYRTPADVFKDIRNTHGQGVANRYWKPIAEGNAEYAQLIQDVYSPNFRNVPIRRFDGGSAHIANRSSHRSGGGLGMVHLSRPVMIVIDWQRLEKYIAHKKGNVGFGKGGWADAARKIGSGSIKGIHVKGDITANWITRKAVGFGSADHGGTDENPTVRVRSAVPYASEILNGGALATAKKIAHDKMVENLRIAVAAEMKKLRTAA